MWWHHQETTSASPLIFKKKEGDKEGEKTSFLFFGGTLPDHAE